MRPHLFALALAAACEPAGASLVEHIVDPSGGPAETGDDTGSHGGTSAAPPVALVSGPASLGLGEVGTFDGSQSYDPSGEELIAYSWTCTDGSASHGATVDLSFTESGDQSCTLEVEAISGLTAQAEAAFTVRSPGVAAWTFMVFVNGDNNLEDAALDDFNEMESVGSTDTVNILVQLDRSADYTHADGNWSGARRFRVEQDEDTSTFGSPTLEDLGDTDSGSPQTIIDFVEWSVQSYPAEHYALVFWDHGWGWSVVGEERSPATKGISQDDGSGNELSVAGGDVEEILAGATAATGDRLDLVGMDACIMGSWEIAHVLAPYAHVFVASQDYEDLDGWAYDNFLDDLTADPTMEAADLGKAIAYAFYKSGDSTQSAVDLDALPDLEIELDALATALIDSGEARTTLVSAAVEAQGFDGNRSVDHDLANLADLLTSKASDPGVGNQAAALKGALEGVIIANYTNGGNVKEAEGLSIYSPTKNLDSLYLEGTWSADTLWDDMLLDAFAP